MVTGQILLRVVIAIVIAVLFIELLAVFARRVLGVHLGKIRITLAAIVGVGAELGFESQVVWPTPSGRVVFIPVQIGILFLVPIAFLVVAEIVLPSGRFPRPDMWLKAIRGSMRRTRRYSQITRIAAKHGLFTSQRPGRPAALDAAITRQRARSLRLALQESGVTFVKLGQQLSTRADLLPPEYIEELSLLQQDVPPARWSDIEALLSAELGVAPGELFDRFDEEPIAAASIGQVHRARLRDGTEVAVKVQRPGIRDIVQRDVEIAIRLARTLQTSTEWGRAIHVTDLAESFAEAVLDQLDYRIEARNMKNFSATIAAHPGAGIVIPAVYDELCTERVLVMDYLDGHTLSDSAAVHREPATARTKIARTLWSCVMRQVMLDGLYHGDLHPGNIMMLHDERLAFIDLGSVGYLDSMQRAGLQQLFLAIDRDNPEWLYDAMFELVLQPDQLDAQRLRHDLGQFMAQYLSVGTERDTQQLFTDLIKLVTAYGIVIPPEIADAFRAFGTMEGTLSSLAPGFDMIEQSRTFASDQLTEQLTPKSIKDTVTDELVTLLPTLRRIPQHIDKLGADLKYGRLSVNIRLLADRRDREVISEWLHLTLLAFLGGITAITAAIMLVSEGGPELGAKISLYQLFGYLLVIVSAGLILRVLFDVFRRRRQH